MTHARRHDLYWLDVPDCVKYRLCVTVYKCLHGMAPQYLSDLCTPVAEVLGYEGHIPAHLESECDFEAP